MERNFCIDIGGSKIKYAFVVGKKVSKYIEVKTPRTKEKLLSTIVNIILKKSKEYHRVCISIAAPIKSGVVQNPPNLPITNFDLQKYLRSKVKNDIFIENDARCAALAESMINKRTDFVLISFGTGIGGAVFINNHLQRKESSAEKEIGHMIIDGKDIEESD